jgi:hypothetical protein
LAPRWSGRERSYQDGQRENFRNRDPHESLSP